MAEKREIFSALFLKSKDLLKKQQTRQKKVLSKLQTKPNKTLSVTGRVEVDYQIYIEQKQWIENVIMPRVKSGEFCFLIAPSQSGKTSRMRNSVIQRLEQEGFVPIFIDMRGLISSYLKTDKKGSLDKLFIDNVNLWLKTKLECSDMKQLFTKKSVLQEYFTQNQLVNIKEKSIKQVVLIMDEFDSMAEVSLEARTFFLTDLMTMRQNKDIYCLYSSIAITNKVGNYNLPSVGRSPFVTTVFANYFNKEEAESFWDEYEMVNDKIIKNEIRNQIYEMTRGHPGQTVMMTIFYDSLCNDKRRKSITINQWYSEILSQSFWNEISEYSNFKWMTNVLSDNFVANSLLDWILDKNKRNLSAADTLLKSNILINVKGEYKFASPFVQKHVLDCLIPVQSVEPLNQLPLLENGQIDFIELIKLAIPNMDRNSIIIDCNRKENHFDNYLPKGAKEILYQTAFERAVRNLLANCFASITQKKQCNTVISLQGNTILVKHCANVAVNDTTRLKTNTLAYNIIQAIGNSKEAVDFSCKENQCVQTYLIHWTNVPSTWKKYEFPESENVNIVYVCHDEFFSKIEIVTKDKHINIEIPTVLKILPQQLLPQQDMPTCNIKLQRASGMLKIGDTVLDKGELRNWNHEQVRVVLLDKDVGVGFDEEDIVGVKLNGFDLENIADALLKTNGNVAEKIDRVCKELSYKIEDPSVREAVVRWVRRNLLKTK